MTDYVFNIYFHTDMVELKSDYTTNLPPFYFALNEFVSPKAEINVINNVLSCKGANIFNGETTLLAGSQEKCIAYKATSNTITGISIIQDSTADVHAGSLVFTEITLEIYLGCWAYPHVEVVP